MPQSKDRTEEALYISDSVLLAMQEYKSDLVVTQSGLGTAWYRLCKSIGYSPEIFREMCMGLADFYEEEAKND